MIRIYGTPVCSWCAKAKELAETNGLKYEYIDLTEGDNMTKFSEQFPGAKSVPQITWYERHLGGYFEFAKEVEETRNYGDGQV